MRPEKPVDAFALELLRDGTEDFEDLLQHKLRMNMQPELEKQRASGALLPYAIVVMVPDGVAGTFDVFCGSNVAPDQSERMLRLMVAKMENREPSVRDELRTQTLPPGWWL